MSLLDTASLIVTPNGYKEGKLYSVIPSDGSGDLSVTRATTATRVNSAGLVELVPYNLLRYSQDFLDGVWTPFSVSVTGNSTTAPDGTLTADTISISSTSFARIQQATATNNLTTGSSCTFSLWIKSVSGTGKVGFRSGQTGVTSLISFTNEWVRYEWTFTAGGTNEEIQLCNSSLVGGADSAPTFYAWGAQLVEGSTAKDYQKTETRLNIPRLDYSNGTCPSLLVEPQRTNVTLWSSSFDNAFWTKNNSTATANATTSPSGIQDADLITSTSTTETGVYYFPSVGGTNTWSVYAKKGTGRYLLLNTDATIIAAKFDLQDGVIVGTPSAGATASIQDAGNGWYRCVITSATSANRFTIFITNNTTTNDLSSSVGLSYYLWGAQLEAGSYATSYIPTTSASVTRNADVISKTGISSLIGQTEGTLFVDEIYDSNAKNNGGLDDTLISLTDGTSNNLISIFHYGGGVGTILLFIRLSNTTQVAISTSASTSGAYKIALAYKNNDVVGYVNGVQIGTDTSATIPATSAVVFYDPVTTNSATKTINIKAAALWKTRLTNAQLATLTTL